MWGSYVSFSFVSRKLCNIVYCLIIFGGFYYDEVGFYI